MRRARPLLFLWVSSKTARRGARRAVLSERPERAMRLHPSGLLMPTVAECFSFAFRTEKGAASRGARDHSFTCRSFTGGVGKLDRPANLHPKATEGKQLVRAWLQSIHVRRRIGPQLTSPLGLTPIAVIGSRPQRRLSGRVLNPLRRTRERGHPPQEGSPSARQLHRKAGVGAQASRRFESSPLPPTTKTAAVASLAGDPRLDIPAAAPSAFHWPAPVDEHPIRPDLLR